MVAATYYFHPPQSMRLFKPIRPGARLLIRTDAKLCSVVVVKTKLVIMSYDHMNKLSLEIEPDVLYVLVDEIEPHDPDLFVAAREIGNYWPGIVPDSKKAVRSKIAQLLARHGYWSGAGPLEAGIFALETLVP